MQQKTAKCKQCKTKHSDIAKMITTPSALGKFCDYDCVADWVRDNPVKIKQLKTKAYNAETKQLAKSFGLKKQTDSPYRKQEILTKRACHAYVRFRDRGHDCICCNKPLDVVHAGHFKASDKYAILRYDEDNIHAQREHCNMRRGGDCGLYEFNLRKKIGNERVNALYEKITGNTGVFRYTIEDLKRIEK